MESISIEEFANKVKKLLSNKEIAILSYLVVGMNQCLTLCDCI